MSRPTLTGGFIVWCPDHVRFARAIRHESLQIDVECPIHIVLDPREDVEAELVDGRPVIPYDETVESATPETRAA